MKVVKDKTPVFGITYGPAKTGKTLATVRAFPDGLFIAPRGALACASWLDWQPECIVAKDINQITQLIQNNKKYPAIIVDDFSIIADAEIAQLKRSHKGWSAFDVFNERVYELRDAARNANCHVLLTMHEQAPKEVKHAGGNRYIPGAPLIPGWQLPEKLPALADFVARVVHDDSFIGWPYVYQVGPDEHYITGDRLSICPDKFPLNLREILLAAGYHVPRPKQLDWMDKTVDRIAQLLHKEIQKEEPNYKPILTQVATKLTDYNPRHIRWAMADAFDRANLMCHSTKILETFIDGFETAVSF